MGASALAISPPCQRRIDDVRMCKLSSKTQLQYIRAVRRLAGFVGRSPDTVTVEDLRRYQLHLVDHGTSSVRDLCGNHRAEFFTTSRSTVVTS